MNPTIIYLSETLIAAVTASAQASHVSRSSWIRTACLRNLSYLDCKQQTVTRSAEKVNKKGTSLE